MGTQHFLNIDTLSTKGMGSCRAASSGSICLVCIYNRGEVNAYMMIALAGAQYIKKMVRSRWEKKEADHLHSGTADAVKREIEHRKLLASNGSALPPGKVAQRWQRAAALAHTIKIITMITEGRFGGGLWVSV